MKEKIPNLNGHKIKILQRMYCLYNIKINKNPNKKIF